MKPLYPTLCTAALLMLAACTNDLAEDLQHEVPGAGTLPQGTFIVDYTATTGDAQTRATGLRPIQSLDYLLYESTDDTDNTNYTLLKRRAIPDIDKNETIWPLTRDNMTWAQREALKDTLRTDRRYKMVFVANVADWIWDNTEEDRLKGSSNIVLQNANLPGTDGGEAPKFEDGRLVLPPEVFTEDDMYYMWSNHDAPLNGKDYGEGNPANVSILLERMINKVEVRLDETIVNEINDQAGKTYADKVKAYSDEKAKAYYESLITANYDDATKAGKLYNSMKDCMEALAKGLKRGAMYPIQYDDAIEKIQDIINHQDFVNGMVTDYLSKTDKTDICTEITQELSKLYQEYCDWCSQVTQVQVIHNTQQESYANKIDFNKKTFGSQNGDDLKYDINNNSFIYYRFGNNNLEESVLNKAQSFKFINEQETEIFSISATDFLIKQDKIGGNQHIIIKCDPLGKQTDAIGTIQEADVSMKYEIEKFNLTGRFTEIGKSWDDMEFGFYAGASLNGFKDALNKNSEFENKYVEFSDDANKSIENLILKIAAPVISVAPTWTQDDNE